MSRSNPTPTNPAQHFFRWSGSKGTLEFYDKEKQENINVPLPFEFMVLDELATIKGYSKTEKAGIWSNEVKSTRTDEFTVRFGNAVRYVGLYKNEQGVVQVPKGANYAQSIYIAHKTKTGDYIIGNFTATGSARSAWFDFKSGKNVDTGKIIMTKGKAQEAQTGEFFPPVFKQVPSTDDEDNIAKELDRELQLYLVQYLTPPKDEPTAAWPSDFDDAYATPDQVAEFEQMKEQKLSKDSDELTNVHASNPMNPEDDFDGEKINLDDIPF